MKPADRHMMGPFEALLVSILRFFQALPKKAAAAVTRIGKALVKTAAAVRRFAVHLGAVFVQGDAFTKLSFAIMGLGCLVRKQIVKGLLFLGLEAGFIAFLTTFGWKYLRYIGTLGVTAESEYIDPVTGIILYRPADNSMLILLYSVFTLVVMVGFFIVWAVSVNACWKAEQVQRKGLPPVSFKHELHSLLDERYHTTLLTAPTLMVFAFVVIPLLFMILIAFTNYDAKHQPPGNLFTWVGLQNFRDIFGENVTKSQTFLYLLRWDFVWAIFATFLNYLLGLVLALMINKKGIKGKKVWRTIFVMTIAVPQFVSLLLISRMFGDSGPVNIILQNLGMEPIRFLTDGKIARVMVVIINLWVGIPYTMLITSGILMNIPAELYESARIDGAGVLRTFFKITMPYVLFVTTPYLITQFVGNFNNFNVIYLLTQGDPKSVWLYQAGETDLLVTWLYKLTVTYQDFNLASVIGIMVFIVSAVMSLIVYNYSASAKREEEFQ
jgi:arabinogalactan oligomer/maltooligosaccharide transport system permease protein